MRGLAVGRRLRVGPVAPKSIVNSQLTSHICYFSCSVSFVRSLCSLGGAFEVAVNKRRHVVLVGVATGASAGAGLIDQVLQETILLRADLLEDIWKHLLHLLRLGLTHDGQEVLAHRELHLGSAEMEHRVVVFEHVHFFNVIKRLHAKLLDCCLDLLVLLDGGLSVMSGLLLNSSLSTFTTELNLSEPSCELSASLSNLVIHLILVLNNKL
mmetsp:Transcript_37364/g.45545  ORF Transcript_37364/g.45545 Transcript_37364/m.45545 type:complete len:211 (-) Transcript_37364:20-652(-)